MKPGAIIRCCCPGFRFLIGPIIPPEISVSTTYFHTFFYTPHTHTHTHTHTPYHKSPHSTHIHNTCNSNSASFFFHLPPSLSPLVTTNTHLCFSFTTCALHAFISICAVLPIMPSTPPSTLPSM